MLRANNRLSSVTDCATYRTPSACEFVAFIS
jgi:hypothetical protein